MTRASCLSKMRTIYELNNTAMCCRLSPMLSFDRMGGWEPQLDRILEVVNMMIVSALFTVI